MKKIILIFVLFTLILSCGEVEDAIGNLQENSNNSELQGRITELENSNKEQSDQISKLKQSNEQSKEQLNKITLDAEKVKQELVATKETLQRSQLDLSNLSRNYNTDINELKEKKDEQIDIIIKDYDGVSKKAENIIFVINGEIKKMERSIESQVNESVKDAQLDKWSYLKSQVVPYFEEIIAAVDGSKFTALQLKSK
ncbi:MAG: hypothetical protein H2015_01155 [Chloroflexi bacterium]|nr:hypothetical protein [Chloroflexota bacterium]|tara:strand:+ start:39 stop:632 length:594 start_codon:yes stop_codon:yes gene_type:complete